MKKRYLILFALALTVTAFYAGGCGGGGEPAAGPEKTPEKTQEDIDGDGVLDVDDNCPEVANADQADLDGDGAGDVCDSDMDNDGAANEQDAFPSDPTEWADTDGDGIGDNADTSGKDGLVWVSVDGNDDTGFGTVDFPFRTIGKAVATTIAEGATKDVHVVGGTYQESVVLGDATSYYGISLRGGYGALDQASNTRSRAISANVTWFDKLLIDGSSGAPVNGSESLIEGFTIFQVSVLNASPTLKDNRIEYHNATCNEGAAITMETSGVSSHTPVLTANHIQNLNCPYGGLISIYMAVELKSSGGSQLSPSFSENEIIAGGGVAHPDLAIAIAGGASDTSSLELALTANMISTGQALASAEAVNLWADSVAAVARLVAERNDIRAGSAPVGYAVDLGYNAIDDTYSEFTSADIQQNKIFGGSECEWSTALSIANASGVSNVANNFISGGNSSVALALAEGISLDQADANIINNSIVAFVSDTAMLIDLLSATALTQIENNILYGDAVLVVGITEALDSSPATVETNLFDSSVDVLFLSDVWGDVVSVGDLEIAYPAYTPNYSGLAMLADPANMDLHIDATSDARDAGGGSFAAADYDGDARPLGAAADIGADEYAE